MDECLLLNPVRMAERTWKVMCLQRSNFTIISIEDKGAEIFHFLEWKCEFQRHSLEWNCFSYRLLEISLKQTQLFYSCFKFLHIAAARITSKQSYNITNKITITCTISCCLNQQEEIELRRLHKALNEWCLQNFKRFTIDDQRCGPLQVLQPTNCRKLIRLDMKADLISSSSTNISFICEGVCFVDFGFAIMKLEHLSHVNVKFEVYKQTELKKALDQLVNIVS